MPHLVGIMRDNVGAATAAAGAVERLAGQPRFAAAIIRQGGVSALVGLLNAGAREAFLPTMRSLKLLSGMAKCLCTDRFARIMLLLHYGRWKESLLPGLCLGSLPRAFFA